MNVLIVGGNSVLGRVLGCFLEKFMPIKYTARHGADFVFDVTKPETIKNVNEHFDVIVHLVADFGGNKLEDFIRTEKVNAIGSLIVCQLASHVGATHLIYISSISASYKLGDPYYGIYSLSKKHSEELISLYCAQNSLVHTILRPSQLYDTKGESRKHQNLLYSILDSAEQGKNILFFGKNDAIRNYLHMDDLVQIVLTVIQTELMGTFTCAAQNSIRLSEIAKYAQAVFMKGGEIIFDDSKSDIENLPEITDFSIYPRIDFCPKIKMLDGIKQIKQYKESID